MAMRVIRVQLICRSSLASLMQSYVVMMDVKAQTDVTVFVSTPGMDYTAAKKSMCRLLPTTRQRGRPIRKLIPLLLLIPLASCSREEPVKSISFPIPKTPVKATTPSGFQSQGFERNV